MSNIMHYYYPDYLQLVESYFILHHAISRKFNETAEVQRTKHRSQHGEQRVNIIVLWHDDLFPHSELIFLNYTRRRADYHLRCRSRCGCKHGNTTVVDIMDVLCTHARTLTARVHAGR